MSRTVTDWILNESQWLAMAMTLSILAVAATVELDRRRGRTPRARVVRAMNLFFASVIGIMGFGHLLAVAVKHAQGSLEGLPILLYPLGIALVVPAAWLFLQVGRWTRDEERWRNRLVAANAVLGIVLLGLGFHNWPLALPAALNVAYLYQSRRAVGWAIVAAALAANLLLFVGAWIFYASGQSFEQFKGM